MCLQNWVRMCFFFFCISTCMIWANRGSLRFLFLMSSRAWDCRLHSCDTCSWNSSPAAPSNCRHEKNKQQFFIHYKETRFKWREMEVTRPTLKLTLASMTSPISWTTGVSLCSFMASQRLAAKTWHTKMNRYLINCTEQNKDQPQQHTL